MIHSYTVVFHGLMTALSLSSLVYLSLRKTEPNKRSVNAYFNWFLFFSLYNVCLILPLVLFEELGRPAAFFYNLSLIFLALGACQGFKVGLNLLRLGKNVRKIISLSYIAGALVVVCLHFVFLELPQISPDGKWIFWRSADSFTSYLYTLLMFVAGWVFAISIMNGFNSLPSLILKARAMFICLAGFILPFAAFYYFGAYTVAHIHLAFFFSILGLFFFLLGNLLGLVRGKRRLSVADEVNA